MKVNVGILVSYDYEYLKISLPLVYDHADTITLAVDENYRTWTGNTFTVDPAFFEWIQEFDTCKKITVYSDDFYAPQLNVVENDTRERNMLAAKMGEGWNIQIDADEYFIDFAGFVKHLKTNTFIQKKPTQICAFWITMYKKLDNGVLYVKNPESFYIGSNAPDYKRCRNSSEQIKVYVPFLALHQSWARDIDELEHKLKNWTHKDDFDVDTYLTFYKSLSKDNYAEHRNFHPLNKKWWQELDFCEGNDMAEVIENLKKKLPEVDTMYMAKKNLGQRIKHFRLF